MGSAKSKMETDYELIAMTYHEASHAICALFNYMKIYQVYVMCSKYDDGHALYEIYDSQTIESKILSKILLIFEIQTLYAGVVGEKIYYKNICGSDAFPINLRIGSSDDISTAAQIISKNNLAEAGKPRLIFKKEIQNDTKKILLEYWDDVRLIAHMLYKQKELSFEDIKFCLTKKSKNSDFWKYRFKAIKSIYDKKHLSEANLKNIILENSIIVI